MTMKNCDLHFSSIYGNWEIKSRLPTCRYRFMGVSTIFQ